MPQTVVITGASAGVGRATAHAFASRGDRVALLARGEKGLEGAAEEVRARGGRALVISCDGADAAAVEAAAVQAEAELGAIDVWVDNAMVGALSRLLEMEADGGPDHLFERAEDTGTRGRFSDQAEAGSKQLALTKIGPDWAAGLVSAAAGHAIGKLQKRLGG